MVKKGININIAKKDLFLILAIGIFIIGVGFVIAYNSVPANPAVFGHTADEIAGLPAAGGGFAGISCTNASTSSGYVEINLIKSGKNICQLPYGCNVLLYSTDASTITYNIDTLAAGRIYLQDTNGNYTEILSGETKGVNGDISEVSIRTFNSCQIYDDKNASGISVSKDNLILYDSNSNSDSCTVSICSRS